MARSILASTIHDAVRLGLAPLLRAERFKSKGNNFCLSTSDCTGLVNVQSSQWNTSLQARFTLNCGIYFPAIDAVTDEKWTKPENETWLPRIYYCHLRRRIGELLPAGGDFWWQVTPSSSVDELSSSLADAWRNYGSPWMMRNLNLREAAAEFERKAEYWPAAASRLALGEPAQASRLAKAYVASLTKEPHHPANAATIEKYLTEMRSWCEKHKLQL